MKRFPTSSSFGENMYATAGAPSAPSAPQHLSSMSHHKPLQPAASEPFSSSSTAAVNSSPVARRAALALKPLPLSHYARPGTPPQQQQQQQMQQQQPRRTSTGTGSPRRVRRRQSETSIAAEVTPPRYQTVAGGGRQQQQQQKHPPTTAMSMLLPLPPPPPPLPRLPARSWTAPCCRRRSPT